MMSLRSVCPVIVLVLLAGPALAKGVSLPEHERVELENGVVLLLSEKHDVPLVGLEAVVRGGAVTDPQGLHGLASLLAGVMEKGAGNRDAAAFAEAVDAVGGELSSSAELEAIRISADFVSQDAELMIELVSDMLLQPTLADIRAKIEKHLKNTRLKQLQAPVGVKPMLKAWMELN